MKKQFQFIPDELLIRGPSPTEVIKVRHLREYADLHQSGDWGDAPAHTIEANEKALKERNGTMRSDFSLALGWSQVVRFSFETVFAEKITTTIYLRDVRRDWEHPELDLVWN